MTRARSGTTPMNSHARTLIIANERDVPGLVEAAGELANGSRNIVYRLHFNNDVSEFETTGDIPWPTDVYLILLGCPTVGGPVEDLCQSIMCPIDPSVKLARHDDVYFYFVDVPSWFSLDTFAADPSLAFLPDTDRSPASRHKAKRLDQDLTQFECFYNYMLNSARIDSVEEYEGWWLSHKNLKYLSKVHYITREEMREHVGDKAYDFTFAPQVMCVPPSPAARDRHGWECHLLSCAGSSSIPAVASRSFFRHSSHFPPIASATSASGPANLPFRLFPSGRHRQSSTVSECGKPPIRHPKPTMPQDRLQTKRFITT